MEKYRYLSFYAKLSLNALLYTSLDQIQKIGKIDSIYLFIEKEKIYGINTHSKFSKNFLTYSIFCFTEVKLFSFEAAVE